jgi:hypothetical protein
VLLFALFGVIFPFFSRVQVDFLPVSDPEKYMIPTRDNDDSLLKKQMIMTDEQNLVTGELVQVLNSKQTRIEELEERLKKVEQQESQWKVKILQERE